MGDGGGRRAESAGEYSLVAMNCLGEVYHGVVLYSGVYHGVVLVLYGGDGTARRRVVVLVLYSGDGTEESSPSTRTAHFGQTTTTESESENDS